jgi:hypothetical protein
MHTMKRSIFLLACFAVTAAAAQPSNTIERKGFVIGASLGAANAWQSFPSKAQHSFDFAFGLKAGWMTGPRTAVLLSSSVTGYDYSGTGRPRKRDFGVVAPSVQHWVNEKAWIMGGAGLAVDAPVFFDIRDPEESPWETKYFTGYGFVISAGYELLQKNKWAISLEARCTYRNVRLHEGSSTGISPGVLVGVNFY